MKAILFFILNYVYVCVCVHVNTATCVVWEVHLYMSYFYWLMDKSVLASGLAQKELGRKTKLNAGRRKMESGRCHVAARGERGELTEL